MTINTIPLAYCLFFLYIEPISALAGAYYAAFYPKEYLQDLSLPSTAVSLTSLPTQTTMALTQLANFYILFAFNEHMVLSSTNSLTTWRRLLYGLLIADFGHLYTMLPLGAETFWKITEWNAMVWGSVGFVYVGASMRIAFLCGVGLKSDALDGNKKAS